MSNIVDSQASLIKEFDALLPKKPYFVAGDLTKIGLFGSPSAATAALKRGTLPSIKMSPKRTVVPRSSVIAYFKKQLEGANLG